MDMHVCVFLCGWVHVYVHGDGDQRTTLHAIPLIFSLFLSLFPLSLLHFFEAESVTGLELKQNRLASQGSLPFQNLDYKPEPLFPFFFLKMDSWD